MKNTCAVIAALAGLFAVDAVARAGGVGAGACSAADGAYLTGEVLSAPVFVGGHKRGKVELSHSRMNIKADQDGQTYQVAIDNVFAAGYDAANSHHQVPAPLDALRPGDRVELCGLTYTHPRGIHWVHTNCGVRPAPNAPDGWIRKIGADGSVSANLEDSREYCRLWP